MFTKDDEITVEKMIRKIMSEAMDEILDIKLKPLYDFRDEATSSLKAIRGLLQGKIHSDNRHASAL